MNSSEIQDLLNTLDNAFKHLAIEYRISGSLASSFLGMPRATLDVDIVANIKSQHITKLANILKNAFYVDEQSIHEAIDHGSSFNLIHLATMYKVDVFNLKSRPFDQIVMSRRYKDSNYITAEDLILNKLEWFELGDRSSERQWSDILGVLRIQAENLDFEYLHHWAEQLGVKELLEQALQESKF